MVLCQVSARFIEWFKYGCVSNLKIVMFISKRKEQILILYGSTLMGVFLGVISSVINTRNLSPVEFGDVRYIQNLISFISSILLFGYLTSGSRLLALSHDEVYSRKIRGAIMAVVLTTMAILSLCMFCFYLVSLIGGANNLTPLYFISIFLGGNVILLNYINTTSQGENHIMRMSLARLLPTLLYVLFAVIVYRSCSATSGLMLTLYNGIAILVLGLIIYSTHPDFKNIKTSFKILNEENKKYGIQVYIGSLAGVSTTYIAGITLSYFCVDNTNVGFYTLALTIANPLSLLPSIIGTTYFKQFATQNRISNKIIVSSLLMSAVTLFLFIIIIDYIVQFLYDDTYRSVSTYASYLAISSSLHGIGDMFNRFLGSHGLGKYLRNGAFVCGFIKVLGSILLVYYYQIWGAIATVIMADMAYLLMMVKYYCSFAQKTA